MEQERAEKIGREAAEVIGLSLHHVRIFLTAYRKEDTMALAHANRGRKPYHALNEDQRKQVLELAQSTWRGV
ncbi:hypothetical protein ACFLYC_02840 [Chloroflexota bacterium]